MNDILTELKEDLRRERLETFVKKRASSIITILAVILGSTWAYGWFADRELAQRQEKGEALVASLQANDEAGQNKLFAEMAKSEQEGYKFIGVLNQAQKNVQAGKQEDAISLLENYNAENKSKLSDLALLKASFLRVEHKIDKEAGIANLEKLSAPNNPWSALAREMLAFEDFSNGKHQKAREEFTNLSSEIGLPQGIKERAEKMLKIIPQGQTKPAKTEK